MSTNAGLNSSAASTIPVPMAMTMSKTTVSVKQVRNTSTSLSGAVFSRCRALGASLMFQATTSSSASMPDMGR